MKWLIGKAKAAKEKCGELWKEYGTAAKNGIVGGFFSPVGIWLSHKVGALASGAWAWFTGAGATTVATGTGAKTAAVLAPLVFV